MDHLRPCLLHLGNVTIIHEPLLAGVGGWLKPECALVVGFSGGFFSFLSFSWPPRAGASEGSNSRRIHNDLASQVAR
jgi:hypothetical protein